MDPLIIHMVVASYTGTGSNARIGGEILFGKNFDGNMAMMNLIIE